MKILAKALLRLDGLSHVLAWTRDPVIACKDAASLDFVELPRLKLRFEAKADGPGGTVSQLVVDFLLLFLVLLQYRNCWRVWDHLVIFFAWPGRQEERCRFVLVLF